MGLVGYMSRAADAAVGSSDQNSVVNIATVAATVEVLSTIANTVGAETAPKQVAC